MSDYHRHQNKEQIYTLIAQIMAAMANPKRLELLDLLVQAPRNVEELASETDMSIANTSQHLQKLKHARLVLTQRHGTYIRYRLADPSIAQLWLQLRTVAEKQLVEVVRAIDAYRDQRYEFAGITANELMARLETGDVILLDARPTVEYEAAHLPGAVSIPWNEVVHRQQELPKDKLIVAYCRGPYCVYADDALAVLADAGWQVARLEEGVLEWQMAGYALN
jgi:rhodanese-related sulfurtransferase